MLNLTIIIPCYNEEGTLPEFYRRVAAVVETLADCECRLLFVNDGSSDATAQILDSIADLDRRAQVIHFARNHGHQLAITAGMDFAEGDAFVIIDSDLQDPPELIGEMVQKMRDGYDVVHAQRRTRAGEGWFKLFSAWLFYRLMSRFISPEMVDNCGDFRAFTKPVLDVVRQFRERHRYMRGIFSTIGFRQCVITYDRDKRYAGETKYPFTKMVKLAINAVLSFSSHPIKLITWCSYLFAGLSVIYLGNALVDHYIRRITVPGWTSIIFLQFFFTGIILFSLGIIGSYIGRIFEQSQNRPLYWVRKSRNLEK